MDIDLRNVPFSRAGSYMAFSILGETGSQPAGLYLRSVHGGAQSATPNGRVALIEVVVEGRPIPSEARATPSLLDLRTIRGTVSLCIAEAWVLRVRGEGVGLRLTFFPEYQDYAISHAEGRWQINCPAVQNNYMLTPLVGCWQVNAPWNGAGCTQMVVDLLPDDDEGFCEGVIEEFSGVWRPNLYEKSFDEARSEVELEFRQWMDLSPEAPDCYQEARRMAAFINWSNVVEPVGHFLRPAIYMSKNQMTSVWSWDHCFNALTLAYRRPMTGWDQFMAIFDQQDEHGGLPDCINDRSVANNFCKPPIHGWTLNWFMDRTNFIRTDQVRQIYGPLCRWTEWWFQYRDDDRDGLPHYLHGNDSGWTNATPFKAGIPLESPDLCAYLVLQMQTLARLASLLHQQEESESWARRADDLLKRLLAHFWQGDHFVALRSNDHLVADTESLFLYLPLILGKRLPAPVRRELIAGLTRPGRFITAYGLATESPSSADYVSDSAWRGPIWAPATLMIVEGLKACGENDLARDIARRFCDLCAKTGFAEHFNAQTGAGLRDQAYSSTASVFLVLAHEYLME